MTEKRFNLITALYALCSDYHSGQWSRGYRILSRIETSYRPRNLPDSEKIQSSDDWEEAREIYNELEIRYADKL